MLATRAATNRRLPFCTIVGRTSVLEKKVRGKSSTTSSSFAEERRRRRRLFEQQQREIKPSSFLTIRLCFSRGQSRYSNQRSFSVRAWKVTGKSFETRDGRNRAHAIFIVVVFCVYFEDVTQHSLVWIGRARVCTRTRYAKRSYCRQTSLTGTFLSFLRKKIADKNADDLGAGGRRRRAMET